MTGFLYVVSTNNLSLNKIGFTKNYRTRLQQLRSNSASAHQWSPWRVYRCDDQLSARRLERLVMRHPTLAAHRMPGKNEFFECRPTLLTAALRDVAATEKIELFDMPYNVTGFDSVASFFPGLPEEVLSALDESERHFYWQGVRDVLLVLSMLPTMPVTSEDFAELHSDFRINREHGGIEVWQTIVGHFRNCQTPASRTAAEEGLKRLIQMRRDGVEEWQSELA